MRFHNRLGNFIASVAASAAAVVPITGALGQATYSATYSSGRLQLIDTDLGVTIIDNQYFSGITQLRPLWIASSNTCSSCTYSCSDGSTTPTVSFNGVSNGFDLTYTFDNQTSTPGTPEQPPSAAAGSCVTA